MIIFDGCLTGNAKKYYINKMIRNATKIMIALITLSIPVWIFLSIKTRTFVEVMSALFIFLILSPFILRLCISKKEKKRVNLKHVCISDGEIKAISEKTIICNEISKIKEVQDHGEFYDIVFPSIYFTSVYICQKNLLSNGSLEEFETLFVKKIVRVKQNRPIKGRIYVPLSKLLRSLKIKWFY